MSILKPTTGKLLDREIECRLLVTFARRHGKDCSHLVNELIDIRVEIDRRYPGGIDHKRAAALDDLEEVHARLAHSAGFIAATKDITADNAIPLATLACDVQELLTRRQTLLEEIDTNLREFVGTEVLRP